MIWTTLCHLHYTFAPPAAQHPLPSPISWLFLLCVLSSPPYNIAASFSFLLHPLSFSALLLGASHWDRGQGPHEGPMCVFVCGGQEKAEEDLPAWPGRSPCCEPGRERDAGRGDVALPWDTASPLVGQGQLLLRATVVWYQRCWATMVMHCAAMRGPQQFEGTDHGMGVKKIFFLVKKELLTSI